VEYYPKKNYLGEELYTFLMYLFVFEMHVFLNSLKFVRTRGEPQNHPLLYTRAFGNLYRVFKRHETFIYFGHFDSFGTSKYKWTSAIR